jgi:hypothetical protein
MSYVYRKTEQRIWTVGYYTPKGEWHAQSDHSEEGEAIDMVHLLNGGSSQELDLSLMSLGNTLAAPLDAINESLREISRSLDAMKDR